MGRKAKLKQNREEKENTYVLRQSDINRMKQDATKAGARVAWKLMLGLPCMALLDTFDFHKVRLNRFLDSVLNKYDSYEKGYITLKDVDDMLRDECGVEVPDDGPVSRRLF